MKYLIEWSKYVCCYTKFFLHIPSCALLMCNQHMLQILIQTIGYVEKYVQFITYSSIKIISTAEASYKQGSLV